MRQAIGIAATAFGILLALAAGAPTRVQAYCPNECKRFDPKQGYCIEYGPVGAGCAGAGASAPARSYGAIAYGSKSGAWGSSYKWGSEAKAESAAMKSCAENGDDCEVVVWFDRKCGAVAANEGKTAFWGLGDSEDQARADAQQKCEQGGGKACVIQASQCSK